MKDTRVLIIDDEKENVRYVTTILEEEGFRDIHGAYDGEEGLEKIEELNPGLILLDLRMPKKNGIYVFNEMKQSDKHKKIPVVILTGEGGFLKHLAELRQFHENAEDLGGVPTEEILNRFISERPAAFLEKPIEPEALLTVVRRILITLDEVKERRWSDVRAVRDRMLERNVTYKGASFETKAQALNHLTALAAMVASGGGPFPDDFVWPSLENRYNPMGKDEFLAFHAAWTTWVYNHDKAAREHKQAIDAATRIEDVEAYDIQKGWPSPTL